MNAPMTRGAAIAAYCKQCIHDSAAFGTWREQVAACTATACPLWRFRPLQDGPSCPDWIKSRDPADLPDGWAKIPQADAVRVMRQCIADKTAGRAVQRGGATRTHGAMELHRPTPRAPETRAAP
ncbi:MAG: hypothetical protein ACREPY_15090 [Rhodanobacteraceae bacterium]